VGKRAPTVYYFIAGTAEPQTAMLHITVRGCPEGIDPHVDALACSIPLEASPSATAQWYSGDTNDVAGRERLSDGTYIVHGITDRSPNDTDSLWSVSLAACQRTELQRYLFVGTHSGDDRGIGVISLSPGGVSRVVVHSYG
jgi:hypothetical protein